MTMGWTAFHYDDANFVVRSVIDGDSFQVQRECLAGSSQVFHDMFDCCDSGYVLASIGNDKEKNLDGPDSNANNTLDLNEDSPTLNMLFHFLHHPPEHYISEPIKKEDYTRIPKQTIPDSSIPFPILPQLIRLSDKYQFTQTLVDILHSHLGAYSSIYPLRVYGYATELGMEDVASKASMYLLEPPLTKYTPDEMDVISTAGALHKLYLLHEYRVKRLREVLKEEPLFPHDYGKCTRLGHAVRAVSRWEEVKSASLFSIEAATDVAELMRSAQDEFKDCETCTKAWNAAVSMLAYKCAKVPRTIKKLPQPS